MEEAEGSAADQAWAARLAGAALAQYAALPRTGKPQGFEFTVLAAIALSFPEEGGAPACGADGGRAGAAGAAAGGAAAAPGAVAAASGNSREGRQKYPGRLAVVALGTGTKCLGGGQRRPDGRALNDCHAEALARRALLLWLHAEAGALLRALRRGAPPATAAMRLAWRPAAEAGGGGWRLELAPGVRLHMVVTRPPCGDAAVIGLACACGSRAGAAGDAAAAAAVEAGLLRTGAKPVKRPRLDRGAGAVGSSEVEQSGAAGSSAAGGGRAAEEPPAVPPVVPPLAHEVEGYGAAQAVGLARRKPGRGDATLSMSCSDKLAKWALLGLQGSLLSGLLAAPLYLDSLACLLPPVPACSTPPAEHAAAAASAARRALARRTAPLAGRLGPTPFRHAPPRISVLCEPGLGPQLDALGLLESGQRRVPAGAALVWRAPPSAAWQPAKCAAPRDKGPAPDAPLRGGAAEAVAGGTGLRAGVARPPAGAPLPAKAASSACKAALFEAAAHLATALRELPAPGSGSDGGQAPGPAPAAPGTWAGAADAPAAPAGAASSDAEALLLTYRRAKHALGGGYQAAWAALRAPPSALEAWLHKPPDQEAFACDVHTF